jgi:hypothetical protein
MLENAPLTDLANLRQPVESDQEWPLDLLFGHHKAGQRRTMDMKY